MKPYIQIPTIFLLTFCAQALSGTVVRDTYDIPNSHQQAAPLHYIYHGWNLIADEYGPFGEPIRPAGPAADKNPIRFSTQYTDPDEARQRVDGASFRSCPQGWMKRVPFGRLHQQTGYIYFGHRHYDPALGRWLSREPLGEMESANLYAFVGNDPFNYVDVLGLYAKLTGQERLDLLEDWFPLLDDPVLQRLRGTLGDGRASLRHRHERLNRSGDTFILAAGEASGHDDFEATYHLYGPNHVYIFDVLERAKPPPGHTGIRLHMADGYRFVTPSEHHAFVRAETARQTRQFAAYIPGGSIAQLLVTGLSPGYHEHLGTAGTDAAIDLATLGLFSYTRPVVAVMRQAGAARNVKPFQVGQFNNLQRASRVGDDLALHHVGQQHVMRQIVPGYNPRTAPAIAVPTTQHRAIPNLTGPYTGSTRDILARDIRNSRNYTDAQNSSLRQLIELNKQMYPISFSR